MANTQIEAMKLALEALEIARRVANCAYNTGQSSSQWKSSIRPTVYEFDAIAPDAITALRRALEQPAIKQGWDVDTLLDKPKQPAQQEIDELTAQRDKLADILTRTANALKGEPAELSLHSWHDLPEVAQQLKAVHKGGA